MAEAAASLSGPGPGPGGVPGDGGVVGLRAKLGAAGGGALELRVQALPADLGADEGLQRVARDAADALRRHHDGARFPARQQRGGKRERALPPHLRAAAAARDPPRSAAPGTGRITHLPSSPHLRMAQGLG
ncbi:hypothetical protein JRQ81_002129, partial [Phrynocephalus forsythii]